MKWYLKAFIQKFLASIPYGKDLNFLLQKRYGELRKIEIAGKIEDITRTFIEPILSKYGKLSGLKVTEIGTGWVPILPITLSLLGCYCKTVDVDRHLNIELISKTLSKIYIHLNNLSKIPNFCQESTERKIKQALQCLTLDDVLQRLNIHYIAPVNSTNLPIDTSSQDITLSRLVLNYIPLDILPDITKELYRTMKPGGLSIHRFGLFDDYASIDPNVSLVNFLKYPSWFWDKFVNNRIKYLNRARYPYYLDLFEKTGFKIVSYQTKLDERSLEALSKMKIAKEFRKYSREELATIGLTVILSKP